MPQYTLTHKVRKTRSSILCFSIAVDKNISKLSNYFGAQISAENSRSIQKIFTAQRQLPQSDFELALGLKPSKKRSEPFKMPLEDGKVFPNYFTSVITEKNEARYIEEMRYRVRPWGSKEEVPTKFNLYNARLDSLLTRKTWQNIFMKNHGIVPFVKFYEWVPGPDQKPKLITFFPEDREVMWAPCLWDEWVSKDGSLSFKSFAIITDDPPPEIEIMGHDRCPVFLKEELIDSWLNPKNENINEVLEMLTHKEAVKYKFEWAV